MEKLRNEAGHRAIVGVRVVEIVGVELDLAVAPVEDRRVRERTIGVGLCLYLSVSPEVERKQESSPS